MAAGDMALNILIRANDMASSVIRGIGGTFGPVGVGLAAVSVGAIAVGVESTKMAADFQTASLSLVAHAGLAQSQFDNVTKSVLAMGPAVGRSPTELAEALYPILSAFSGIQNQSAKSAIALDTLKMSFQTVAGTTVDGTAVANAAVGTFNALGLATNNVGENTKRMTGLFDVMDRTVQLGNMQWDAYKNVVSKLAVAIQGTGISFNESQAALAEMTNEGFSAQRASTYLANTFTTLAIKTDALAKHAKTLKIPFNESAYAGMDLAHKIEYLNQVTDGNKQKLLALMGNNSTALKTFNALSVGIGNYKSNLDALNHSQGALASSFDTASKGFNFQMQQVKASGDALMITIGTQLLPVASRLLAQVLPLITGFTKWLTEGDRLKNTITVIAVALSGILTVIGGVASGFGLFVDWLAQGSPLATAVGIALLMIAGGFAAIQIGAFIAAVPAIVAGFIAWSVAAWSAAIATIAATWPIFLIGVAVVAVVAIIIIVVRNWGAISKWLVAAWHAAINWLMGALHSIGQFFVSVWNGIKSATTSVWNFLVGVVKEGAHLLYLVIFGPFLAIGALFSWLYNHNTYIKQLCDSIVGFFQSAFKWLSDQWSSIIGWIVGQWNYLKNMAEMYFLLVYVAIEIRILQVQAFVYSIFTSVVNFLKGIWNVVWGDVVSVWTKIYGIFSSAWQTYVAGPLGKIRQGIIDWFSNLGNSALTAGKNLINMLVQGITSGAGAIWNAVSGIAKNIWAGLGFHSPTEAGPGRDADRWMPNLITMLVRGLNAGVPAMRTAALNVAAPLAQIGLPVGTSGGLNARGNAFALGGSAGNAFALQGSSHTIVIQVQPAKADITLDGRKVGDGVMKYAAREIRVQGNIRNK